MNDKTGDVNRTNSTEYRGRRMLLKLFLIARDRPILFFLTSIPLLFAVNIINIAIISIIFHTILIPLNLMDAVIFFIVLFFLPIAPAFYTVGFLFLEFLFFITYGQMRVNWTSIFRRRILVNALISWADKKHTNENIENTTGE